MNADKLYAMPIYALTIFLGAFLLFLVQPLIGKYILPWFGGAPAVWTTCMLFFQLVLLAGYAYAHFSARWLKPRAQAIVHLVLLAAALAALQNITPSNAWKPTDGADPTLRILGLLCASIGLPYFVLAATSPLMQHWFSRTNPGVSPFRLYALSNIGSILALLSFPVFFETHFTRPVMAQVWAAGLVMFAVSCSLCAWKLWRAPSQSMPAGNEPAVAAATPTILQKALWLLLPACASVLLLAITNMICQEVAVIPFLWVLPLALYLLSFIICFDSPRWYVRLPFAVALVAALVSLCWALFQGPETSTLIQLGIYSVGLFICCMVCHGELYRLRPNPRHLTSYYLMIAAGGAVGGLFVAVIAPLIFDNYFELQLGLLLCAGLLVWVISEETREGGGKQKPKQKVLMVVLKYRKSALAGGWMAIAALGVAFWMQAHQYSKSWVEKSRNFYGVLTVFKYDNDKSKMHYLQFSHGRTMHGMQFTDPVQSRWPTTYFSEISGIGLLMHATPAGHRRIGVIGLGAGTLAAYPQTGDTIRFYEINPEVMRIASKWFTYLSNCPGKVEVVLGDARLSLEREPSQNFDLFVIDAFNSDAIPVHLLTKEAFAIYERHLKTNGIIAVHVSNKRLNLDPVVANLAQEFHYKMVVVDSPAPQDKPWLMSASWILLARNTAGEEIINLPTIQLASRPPLTNAISIPLWTDDFASLFQIVRPETSPQTDPTFTDAQCQLAFNLYQQGNVAGAIAQFRQALKTLPRSPVLLGNLAFLLVSCPDESQRSLPEATRLAEQASQLTHYHDPIYLTTLGIVYSEIGRFPEAIQMAEKARTLATEASMQVLVQKNEELLKLYHAHRAFHEGASP